ncbi:MAG: META domain-containing protein [Acidimicrobiales bacterium]
MPDPYDPDAVRRALDEASPAADLWAEAERRAADRSVVPLATGGGRRPGRWLAVAAIAALAVSTVAVITSDDDQAVDTNPSDSSPRTSGPLCDFASPRILQRGPAPALITPERTDTGRVYFSGLGPAMLAADTQQLEVAVPSDPRADADARETTPVELERGSALLRTTPYFTQVRWEPEGAGLCATFSVTLQSRPSDATTQVVVDLANDIELLGELPAGGQLTSVADPTDCRVAISGEPVSLPRLGPVDQPILGSLGAAPDQATVQYQLGSQRAEVSVPGFTVQDLLGERVEDLELARGTAQIWFTEDFVQVRWFPGGDEPCDSFTVTVAGGTEDSNRHVAVDLADRLLLASDLAGPSLRGTEWQLERSTIDGQPTDGDGSTFRFRQNDVSWSDGCNQFNGSFRQDFATQLVIGGDDPTTAATGTKIYCPPNATSDAVSTVMASNHRIDVRYEDNLLILTAGLTELVLRPLAGAAENGSTTAGEGFAIWPETSPGDVGDGDGTLRSGSTAAVRFADEVLGWTDAATEADQSEPSEDGREGGEVHTVRSPSRGSSVSVNVAPARLAGPGPFVYVVYRVDVPGRTESPGAEESVRVAGSAATAVVLPVGDASVRVRFIYGDDSAAVDGFGRVTIDRDPLAPGAVLVLLLDIDDEVIGAWGRALPAGDFAVG